MKILLFGANGCFGTEFEAACAGRPVTLVGLTHADIDITDTAATRARIEGEAPDAVINSVAWVGINPCEQDPDRAFSIHVTAALAMIKACAARDIAYVQTSTHAVFDGTKIEPYGESDVPNPGNIYGISKYAAELATLNQCPRGYVVRFPTMYGRRRNQAPGFVDKVLAKLRTNEDLRIADDKIDSLSYARDNAESVLGLLLDARTPGVYHAANTGAVSYYDFVCTLKEMVGSRSVIHRAKDADFPSPAPKPLRTAIVSEKLPPQRPWQEALRDYVDNVLNGKENA